MKERNKHKKTTDENLIEKNEALDQLIASNGNIIARILLRTYKYFAKKYEPIKTKSKFIRGIDYAFTSLIYGRFGEEEQGIVSKMNGVHPHLLTIGYECIALATMIPIYISLGQVGTIVYNSGPTIGLILSVYSLTVGTHRLIYAAITKKTFRSFGFGDIFLNYKANLNWIKQKVYLK